MNHQETVDALTGAHTRITALSEEVAVLRSQAGRLERDAELCTFRFDEVMETLNSHVHAIPTFGACNTHPIFQPPTESAEVDAEANSHPTMDEYEARNSMESAAERGDRPPERGETVTTITCLWFVANGYKNCEWARNTIQQCPPCTEERSRPGPGDA